MSALSTHVLPDQAPTDLEALLLAFLRYGKPRLSFLGAGWHCCIEMHVSSQGATFEVKSDFKQASPAIAARQCWDRMAQTLKDLNA